MQSDSAPVIGMIWAQTLNGVIGRDGDMPWHVPEDLAHFKAITAGHPVVMGRRTWESFPPKFRPLPDRTNIIVSRTLSYGDQTATQDADPQLADPSVQIVGDFGAALTAAAQAEGAEKIWVIGGGSIYEQALDVATLVERTVFNTELGGDTYAPSLDDSWTVASTEPAEGWFTSSSGMQYRFEQLQRPVHD